MSADDDGCPACHSPLTGPPIPENLRAEGYYGPPETAPTDYSRRIGIELPGVCDGVAYWQCPDCGHSWHRFPPPGRISAAVEAAWRSAAAEAARHWEEAAMRIAERGCPA